MEQIDLVLVDEYKDHEDYDTTPFIWQEVGLPLLNSIIETDGCQLKYVRVPRIWYRKQVLGRMIQFSKRYNQIMRSRRLSCSRCNNAMTAIRGEEDFNWFDNSCSQLGVCYSCLKTVCDDCETDDCPCINWCSVCDKMYCWECADITYCECGESACEGCQKKCDDCERFFL